MTYAGVFPLGIIKTSTPARAAIRALKPIATLRQSKPQVRAPSVRIWGWEKGAGMFDANSGAVVYPGFVAPIIKYRRGKEQEYWVLVDRHTKWFPTPISLES